MCAYCYVCKLRKKKKVKCDQCENWVCPDCYEVIIINDKTYPDRQERAICVVCANILAENEFDLTVVNK